MFDIALSNSGDFIAEPQKKYPTFKIEWRQSTYPTFKINFLCERTSAIETTVPENSFSITFDLKKSEEKNFSGIRTFHDLDALRQKIIILLRTEIGETVLKKDLGTRLVLLKHLDMNKIENLQAVHALIKENLVGILDDPIVMVRPEYREGSFYCQNVNVYINDGATPIFNFSI